MNSPVNPFRGAPYDDALDLDLIARALAGDRKSLSDLLKRHQPYIYNVALKMLNHVADAEDLTQEILVKLVTSLSQYNPAKGRFRTWLYRITFNHFLNLKKQPYEQAVPSFEVFFEYIENTPDAALTPDEEQDLQLAIEESKVACMAGMLMCLAREQRLVYIVGEVFEIDHQLASEIFAVSPANFRQKLSRARKDLYQWMHNRCGLVNQANPCRCPKKTKGFIQNGWVNPAELKWHRHYTHTIHELAQQNLEAVLLDIDDLYARLYKDHPFKLPQTSQDIIEAILGSDHLRETFKLSRK